MKPHGGWAKQRASAACNQRRNSISAGFARGVDARTCDNGAVMPRTGGSEGFGSRPPPHTPHVQEAVITLQQPSTRGPPPL